MGSTTLGTSPPVVRDLRCPPIASWEWSQYLRRAEGLTRTTPNHCCQCPSHFRWNRAPQLLLPPCKPLKGATKRRCQWCPVRHPRVWSDQWRPSRLGLLGSFAQHIVTSSPAADRESISPHRGYRPQTRPPIAIAHCVPPQPADVFRAMVPTQSAVHDLDPARHAHILGVIRPLCSQRAA